MLRGCALRPRAPSTEKGNAPSITKDAKLSLFSLFRMIPMLQLQKFCRLAWLILVCSLVVLPNTVAAQATNIPPDVVQALAQERFRNFVQTMDVTMIDSTFNFTGTSRVEFVNNTGDTLRQLFFHAHFNAFQPNSPTHRRAEQVGPNRLNPATFANLKPSEYGKLDITKGTLNGENVSVHREWTIIRIDFTKPIAPQETAAFTFEFAGQVPKQIRRSGRMNAQGVRYSMAQWFPKLCQYDQHGWHNNQFVAREFYGVWGRYDLNLTLPAKYIVGATGELQNPQEVGHGYELTPTAEPQTVLPAATKPEGMKTWRFKAFPVHDFAWTADDDYAHTIIRYDDKLTLHALFKQRHAKPWEKMKDWLPRIFRFMGSKYYPYPYNTFTCTQAGDGGMEYPQLVMITHRADPVSLLGVTIHEIVHQWFYGLAADNETKHAWMDEGLTDYMTTRMLGEEFGMNENPVRGGLEGDLRRLLVPERTFGLDENVFYLNLNRLNNDEPLSLPHDRFNSEASAVLVYRKGAAMLRQFEYSFGQAKVDEMLRTYVQRWKFRHPYPADFEKVCEDVFGQRMDEVFDTFLLLNELPDYRINALNSAPDTTGSGKWRTTVALEKKDRAHVPLKLLLLDASGTTEEFALPSDIASAPNTTTSAKDDPKRLPVWYWTHRYDTVNVLTDREITLVRLDTTGKLLDTYLPDNIYQSNTAFWQGFGTLTGGLLGGGAEIFGRGYAKTGWFTRFDEAQPLDYTGVSLRPTLWYNPLGGLQVGFRTDITSNWNRQRFFGGVYLNTRGTMLNWQFGTSGLVLDWGRFKGVGSGWIGNVDGVLGAQFKTDFTMQSPLPWTLKSLDGETTPANPLQSIKVTFGFDIYRFDDRTYFPTFTDVPPPLQERFFVRIFAGLGSKWQGGWTQTDVGFSLASADRALYAGQLTQRTLVTLFDTPYFAGKIRSFFALMSTSTPLALMPTLTQATAVEQFDNIPFRFVRFLPAEQAVLRNRIFLPNGSGFVRGDDDYMPLLLSLSFTLGETKTLEALGVNVPVLNALKPNVYVAGAVGAGLGQILGRGGVFWRDVLHFDSGVSLTLNLNDVVPGSRLLWTTAQEVSATLTLPLLSHIPSRGGWLLGTDGVRVTISTIMPQ